MIRKLWSHYYGLQPEAGCLVNLCLLGRTAIAVPLQQLLYNL